MLMAEESLFEVTVEHRDYERIALIADIHANYPALVAVLEDMEKRSFDGVISLGDLVGYYTRPVEVLDATKPIIDIGVMGNHDWAAVDLSNPLYKIARPAAQRSLEFTNPLLREDQKKYLLHLPLKTILETPYGTATLVHGHPVTIFDYVYGPTTNLFLESIEKALAATTTDYLFVGHSHIQGEFYSDTGKIFVNPGSIGQPRDNDFRAAYAIVDLKNKSNELIRVPYDIEEVIDEVHQCHLPEELGSRLKFGV
ncbi:MAG: metallophosphoesterase [Methanobacteriota archaeon]|nr:MAG: metallophosphoesterase [Euryarchaeota archaeon]